MSNFKHLMEETHDFHEMLESYMDKPVNPKKSTSMKTLSCACCSGDVKYLKEQNAIECVNCGMKTLLG